MGFGTASAPAQGLGYTRHSDWPTSGGAGPAMQSDPTYAPGLSSSGGALGSWHPTVVWMLGFVVFELVVFHTLSHFMNI